MQDRRIYITDLMRLTGIKTRKTVGEHVKRGIPPPPKKQLNGRLTWLMSEVCAVYDIPITDTINRPIPRERDKAEAEQEG